jgi:hypothetical protein
MYTISKEEKMASSSVAEPASDLPKVSPDVITNADFTGLSSLINYRLTNTHEFFKQLKM